MKHELGFSGSFSDLRPVAAVRKTQRALKVLRFDKHGEVLNVDRQQNHQNHVNVSAKGYKELEITVRDSVS